MIYLRIDTVPDKHGMVAVWFDLDAKHETYIKIDRNMTFESLINVVEDLKDKYRKGQYKV